MSTHDDRITVPSIRSRKGGRLITAVTAYDYTMARLIDASGVDLILVGDSVGSVVQGHGTTIPVTLDQMIYHSACVTRGARRALVIGDMPFMSYQSSTEEAILSAGRLFKEGGVSAVKLEGGTAIASTIKRLVELDLPVVGHVGLTPQSYHRMGGHVVQGRKRRNQSREQAGTREKIIEDALAVEEAGAFALVVECVPGELAAEITRKLEIPVIGIGAGSACDGQILVINDLLGFSSGNVPRFVKKFADLSGDISGALAQYCSEVEARSYPGPEHTFEVPRALDSGKRSAKRSA